MTTNPLKLNGITGATEPGNKIAIAFNQYMNLSSLLATEYTLVDGSAPQWSTTPNTTSTGGKILINADLQARHGLHVHAQERRDDRRLSG